MTIAERRQSDYACRRMQRQAHERITDDRSLRQHRVDMADGTELVFATHTRSEAEFLARQRGEVEYAW